jgi:hypothetical protein
VSIDQPANPLFVEILLVPCILQIGPTHQEEFYHLVNPDTNLHQTNVEQEISDADHSTSICLPTLFATIQGN